MLRSLLALTALFFLMSCVHQAPSDTRSITLLFTNDLESAYEPVDAFWRDDMARIGGYAQLATLIKQQRALAPSALLLDAGDIFTGTIAKRTQGRIAFELMDAMGFEAMAIGNHEFEYGWEVLAEQMRQAPFHVLAANLRYRDTGRPFAKGSVILERDSVRIGVIGIIGRDAATALIPSNIAGLIVDDPIETTRKEVERLDPITDLIVVLTHQGATAPMQTNDEADPSVYRGNAANVALAGAVPGIDVILAGHTDAGTREPIQHPETGTLIMQTYGQGQHLGRLQLTVDGAGKIVDYEGTLLEVNADDLAADQEILSILAEVNARLPDLQEVLATAEHVISRRYYQESDLGNLFADLLRSATNTDVALMPSGALRKDLPAGPIRRVDLLDAFPFEDRVAVADMSGATLKRVLEQGLSLERGLLQVSGLTLEADMSAEPGSRLIRAQVGGQPLTDELRLRVSTVEIIAKGGDLYTSFLDAYTSDLQERTFAEVLEREIAAKSALQAPPPGRILQWSRTP